MHLEGSFVSKGVWLPALKKFACMFINRANTIKIS